MTCIIGIEDRDTGACLLGADSFAGSSSSRDLISGSKIQRIHGALWAASGGFGIPQSLKFLLPKRRKIDDIDRYLLRCAGVLHTASNSRGAISTSDGAQFADFELICAIEGRVIRLQPDFSWFRSARGYCAIGAGEEYAVGALCATRDLELSIVERAEIVLECVHECCSHVSPPFQIEVL